MATAFTLKFGSLDLSQYVRVGPQDGLDVYGNGWEDPQFNAGAGPEGPAFVSTDVKVREMVWPMFLNSTSKDLVAALRQQVQREVRYGAQPLRVEWKDNGSGNSTFYDVGAARLEEHQNYRLNDHDYTDTALRIWCTPPWGHTATQRIVASGGAAGLPVTIVPIPSLIGDADPLIEVGVSRAAGQYNSVGGALRTIVSLIPPGATGMDQNIASFTGAGGTIVGASGAIGSQVQRLLAVSNAVHWNVIASGVQRARVVALTRRPSSVLPFRLDTICSGGTYFQSWASPIANGAWTLVDCGVFDTSQAPLFNPLDFAIVLATMSTVNGATAIDLNRVWVLPEDNTMVLTETPPPLLFASVAINPSYLLSNAQDSYVRQSNTGFTFNAADVSPLTVGQLPRPRPGLASQALMVIHLQEGGNAPAQRTDVSVAVRERFSFQR